MCIARPGFYHVDAWVNLGPHLCSEGALLCRPSPQHCSMLLEFIGLVNFPHR